MWHGSFWPMRRVVVPLVLCILTSGKAEAKKKNERKKKKDAAGQIGGLDIGDMMKGMEGLNSLGGGQGGFLDMQNMFGSAGGVGGINKIIESLGGAEKAAEALKGLMGKGDIASIADKLKGAPGDLPDDDTFTSSAARTISSKNSGYSAANGGQNADRTAFCVGDTTLRPVPRADMFRTGNGPDGKLVANGCGPAGMRQDEPYGLSKCCNMHDLCYSVCDPGFEYCEKRFASCMNKICHKQKGKGQQKSCKKSADAFTSLTKLAGKMFYRQGMKTACEEQCYPEEEAREISKNFLEAFYSQHEPEKVVDVPDMLDKYKGKEGTLWVALLQKYAISKSLVHFDDIKEEL